MKRPLPISTIAAVLAAVFAAAVVVVAVIDEMGDGPRTGFPARGGAIAIETNEELPWA